MTIAFMIHCSQQTTHQGCWPNTGGCLWMNWMPVHLYIVLLIHWSLWSRLPLNHSSVTQYAVATAMTANWHSQSPAFVVVAAICGNNIICLRFNFRAGLMIVVYWLVDGLESVVLWRKCERWQHQVRPCAWSSSNSDHGWLSPEVSRDNNGCPVGGVILP